MIAELLAKSVQLFSGVQARCFFLANSVFRGVLIEREKVTRSNNPLTQLIAILKAGESLPSPLLCSVNIGAPIQVLPAESKDAFLIRARAAVENGSRA